MFAVFLKMIGICIGYSVLRIIFRQNFIENRQMTKIVSAYFMIQILNLLFVHFFLLSWLLIYFPVLLFSLLHFFYIKRLESQFCIEFPDMMTSLILQMKMGVSFRKSLQNCISVSPAKFTGRLQYIFENVVFSPQEIDKKMTLESIFLHEVIMEFKKIDQTTHKSIEKIENFRRRLITINKFRRRSGRIRGQVHLQAGLMTIIYLLCFAAMAFMFPLQQHFLIVGLSLFLFILGLIGVCVIGQRIKWSI